MMMIGRIKKHSTYSLAPYSGQPGAGVWTGAGWRRVDPGVNWVSALLRPHSGPARVLFIAVL